MIHSIVYLYVRYDLQLRVTYPHHLSNKICKNVKKKHSSLSLDDKSYEIESAVPAAAGFENSTQKISIKVTSLLVHL